jgi:hypothetical protein
LVEVTGIPARVIRSQDEVAEIREQQAQAAQAQAQQQEQMMDAEMANQLAPMVKAVAQ